MHWRKVQRLPESSSALNNRIQPPTRKRRYSLVHLEIAGKTFITDVDGVGVTIPLARATNGGIAAAGVVASASISAGDYGLIQVYGYHSAVRVRTVTGGTPAIAKGRPLVMNVAGSVFCLESVATASTSILVNQIGFALAANSSFTTLAKAAFIKSM